MFRYIAITEANTGTSSSMHKLLQPNFARLAGETSRNFFVPPAGNLTEECNGTPRAAQASTLAQLPPSLLPSTASRARQSQGSSRRCGTMRARMQGVCGTAWALTKRTRRRRQRLGPGTWRLSLAAAPLGITPWNSDTPSPHTCFMKQQWERAKAALRQSDSPASKQEAWRPPASGLLAVTADVNFSCGDCVDFGLGGFL